MTFATTEPGGRGTECESYTETCASRNIAPLDPTVGLGSGVRSVVQEHTDLDLSDSDSADALLDFLRGLAQRSSSGVAAKEAAFRSALASARAEAERALAAVGGSAVDAFFVWQTSLYRHRTGTGHATWSSYPLREKAMVATAVGY